MLYRLFSNFYNLYILQLYETIYTVLRRQAQETHYRSAGQRQGYECQAAQQLGGLQAVQVQQGRKRPPKVCFQLK